MPRPSSPLILFAPASGPGVGGGHVMRSLALAQALHLAGAKCIFAVGPDGRRLLEAFAGPEIGVQPFNAPPSFADLAEVCRLFNPAAIVVDDYGLDQDGEALITPSGATLIVIDDLADRPHRANILIDPGFGRGEGDYSGLVPPTCRPLCGPAYALVRPEIAGAAHRFSATTGPCRRALISFGLSDVGAIAARATRLALHAAPDLAFDVALASDAPSVAPLRELAATKPGLSLHPDARDMAGLMASADLAIGAGGSATWERCAFALPTLAVIVADNQRAMIKSLADHGVVLAVDLSATSFENDFTTALERLRDDGLRQTLAARALTLCDGQGAGRVAHIILESLRRD